MMNTQGKRVAGRQYRGSLGLTGTMISAMLLAGCAVKPQPLDLKQIQASAQESLATLRQDEPPLVGTLSPQEAVARALLYNRERHVKTMQAALASNQLAAANYDMLPSLTAQAGYTTRSEFAATESVPLVDGRPLSNDGPSQFSIAQEKNRYTYGVDFTWSVLDFGLSYVRAKQQADKYLIAREEERKAVQNLAQEVRTAYWKSVSANRLLGKVEPLMAQVDEALDNSRRISRERLSDPLNNYSYERSLLDVKRSLQSLRSELIGARETLASLMGLPPTTPISLPAYDSQELVAPKAKLDVDTMEETALLLRPEILTAQYRQRIARNDVRAAFLQMFPDLSLTAGYQHDSNDFLRYQDWTSAGVAVSYDLLNVFKVNANRKTAKVGVEVAKQQLLAASLAVLTQVHLAALQYRSSEDDLATAENYLTVSRNISDLVTNQGSTGSVGQLTVIKEQLNSLVAELRRDLAYAQIQNSFARVYQSMGLDPYPVSPGQTPAELAKALAARRTSWEEGNIAVLVDPISNQEPILQVRQPGEVPTFQFASGTFALAGHVHYNFATPEGQGLPDWLEFNPATRTFSARAGMPMHSVVISIRAENDKGVYATDRFRLIPGQGTA